VLLHLATALARQAAGDVFREAVQQGCAPPRTIGPTTNRKFTEKIVPTSTPNGRQDALLTYAQAASELNVSKRTLHRWIDAGRIPVVVLSQRVKRIRQSDLRMFVHEAMAPGGPGGHGIQRHL